MTSRTQLAAAVKVDESTSVGERITDPGSYATIDAIPPGESRQFSFTVDVDLLNADTPGVYWFGVHALGERSGEARDELFLADGRARTFLPLVPPGRQGQEAVSVVVPLRRNLSYADDGALDDLDRWTTTLGDGGRLRALVDLAATSGDRTVSWVIDPALVDAVRQLAGGNPPRTIAPTSTRARHRRPTTHPPARRQASSRATTRARRTASPRPTTRRRRRPGHRGVPRRPGRRDPRGGGGRPRVARTAARHRDDERPGVRPAVRRRRHLRGRPVRQGRPPRPLAGEVRRAPPRYRRPHDTGHRPAERLPERRGCPPRDPGRDGDRRRQALRGPAVGRERLGPPAGRDLERRGGRRTGSRRGPRHHRDASADPRRGRCPVPQAGPGASGRAAPLRLDPAHEHHLLLRLRPGLDRPRLRRGRGRRDRGGVRRRRGPDVPRSGRPSTSSTPPTSPQPEPCSTVATRWTTCSPSTTSSERPSPTRRSARRRTPRAPARTRTGPRPTGPASGSTPASPRSRSVHPARSPSRASTAASRRRSATGSTNR